MDKEKYLSGPLRYFLLFLMILWFLVLCKFILFKHQAYVIINYFNNQFPAYTLEAGINSANFVPFKSILSVIDNGLAYQYGIHNNWGNIIGFFPAGILLPVLFRRLQNAGNVVLSLWLISLFFETIQLFTGLGIFDIDDLLLNCLGGMLGFFCWKFIIFRLFKHGTGKVHS